MRFLATIEGMSRSVLLLAFPTGSDPQSYWLQPPESLLCDITEKVPEGGSPLASHHCEFHQGPSRDVGELIFHLGSCDQQGWDQS